MYPFHYLTPHRASPKTASIPPPKSAVPYCCAICVAAAIAADVLEDIEALVELAGGDEAVADAEGDPALADAFLLPHVTDRHAVMPLRSLGWLSTQLVIHCSQTKYGIVLIYEEMFGLEPSEQVQVYWRVDAVQVFSDGGTPHISGQECSCAPHLNDGAVSMPDLQVVDILDAVT